MNEFDYASYLKENENSLTYDKMNEYIRALASHNPILRTGVMGKSILGKSLDVLTLGEGKRTYIFVASHHAMEWITSLILLRFIGELCERTSKREQEFGVDLSRALANARFVFVPMLNPDGVDLQIRGIEAGGILSERLRKMNGGDDFSHWQANARGVDLNHNYDAGFDEYKKLEAEYGIHGGAPTRFSGEYPESEPECRAMCNLIRALSPDVIYTFHTQGEEIFYTSGDCVLDESLRIGKLLSEKSGYALSCPEGLASYGGLTDWALTKMKIPSFTIECGLGKNPLPPSDADKIYEKIREMLFISLTL